MNVYEALYTTRSMRRMKPDPIPDDVQARIIDAAIRAPSPSDSQRWRFLLVDDPEIKAKLAPIYQENFANLVNRSYARQAEIAKANPQDPANAAMLRRSNSAQHLADHWAEVPLFLIGFVHPDQGAVAVYPALWSAMLAARAEGVGSTLTTLLTATREDEVKEILGVPADEPWTTSACIALGYPTGTWGVAARRPVNEVSFRNQWGTPLGFEVPEPLWSPE